MRRRRSPANGARAAVAYVRVSTGRQAAHGVSLEAQEASIRAYCERAGIVLAEVVSDVMSGSRADRPGLVKIVAGVRAGEIGTVVIAKLDRAFRSFHDAVVYDAEFERHGAKIIAVDGQYDSSPTGQFQKHIMYSFAELERAMIAARTRDALDRKREERRVYCGIPPFGWRADDGRLVLVEEEQRVLAELKALRADGASYPYLAAVLNERGVKPHRAAKWWPATVRNVLVAKINNEVAA